MSIAVKERSPRSASPSRRSRVTPGRSSTSASLRPTRRLNKVDLPTFGRPTIATEGTRVAASGGITVDMIAPPAPVSRRYAGSRRARSPCQRRCSSARSSAACRRERRDLDLRLVEALAHRFRERHGRRRVAVDAHRVDGDLLHLAGDAGDGLLLDHALDAQGDEFGIVQHGAGLAARHEEAASS